MDDIYRNNFIEAIKSAQRSIYFSFTISGTLFLLATLDKIDLINVPGINVPVDAVAGLSVLIMLYIGAGTLLSIQTFHARQNIKGLKNLATIKAILKHPSIITGPLPLRLSGTALPIAMFALAMHKGFGGGLLYTWLTVGLASIPYYAALSFVYEIEH